MGYAQIACICIITNTCIHGWLSYRYRLWLLPDRCTICYSLGRGGFGTGLLVFMIGVAVQQCFEDALAERRTHWLRTSIDGSKLLLAVRLI